GSMPSALVVRTQSSSRNGSVSTTFQGRTMRTALMPSGVKRGSTSEDWAWSPIPISTGSARAAVAVDTRPTATATIASAALPMMRRLPCLDERPERSLDLDAICLTDVELGDERRAALSLQEALAGVGELH